MRLALIKQRTRMTHSGSAAKYFVYESGCGGKKSVIWASEAWEINWIRFPTTEGMVQLPRGSTRARKVAKQQISVNFNSRARNEMKFSHFLFVSPCSFQFSSILKKKLRWLARGGHIPLHSENLPARAGKKGLAGQYFGHPWSRR